MCHTHVITNHEYGKEHSESNISEINLHLSTLVKLVKAGLWSRIVRNVTRWIFPPIFSGWARDYFSPDPSSRVGSGVQTS